MLTVLQRAGRCIGRIGGHRRSSAEIVIIQFETEDAVALARTPEPGGVVSLVGLIPETVGGAGGVISTTMVKLPDSDH